MACSAPPTGKEFRFVALLDRVKPSAASYRVLVSGLDDERIREERDAGASWIFSRDDLSRALLAVQMNGAPLPRDHGSPVRLIVPGWYGCACIKWVNRIELVPTRRLRRRRCASSARNAPAFGLRTPLDSVRAREYIPAVIDTAAMPVRVEKMGGATGASSTRSSGSSGRRQGDQSTVDPVQGEFALTRVRALPCAIVLRHLEHLDAHVASESPGRYTIVLRVDDPTSAREGSIWYFYARAVQIDEV